jgi:2-polyprenyl-3-methyl-5-hydroxy-6-metoxy-1,4-benzoquinol methylase
VPSEVIAKKPCYLRSEQSAAFIRYCERVYGVMLNQYGTADVDQLALMLDVLNLRPGSHVLDIGCGTGGTTRYLAEKSGARFIGVDSAEPAIVRAQEIAAISPEWLAFKVGTMEALDFSPGSFDAVIAIESLYLCKDLASTIGQFNRLLRARSQMALFYTYIADGPGDRLSANHAKLGAALRANGIVFNVFDLSESDRNFWMRSKIVADEMRAEFEAEGNADLMHLDETEARLSLIEEGRQSRYLYHARVR